MKRSGWSQGLLDSGRTCFYFAGAVAFLTYIFQH